MPEKLAILINFLSWGIATCQSPSWALHLTLPTIGSLQQLTQPRLREAQWLSLTYNGTKIQIGVSITLCCWFKNRVWLCSLGWSWTHDPVASTSQVLGTKSFVSWSPDSSTAYPAALTIFWVKRIANISALSFTSSQGRCLPSILFRKSNSSVED